MSKRTWIKIFTENWITGTIRDEKPEIRATWVDLLALIGLNQHSDTGELKLINGIGYSDHQIAQILKIEPSLWVIAKDRLIETERITVSPMNEIKVTNWSKYQSEYSRVKQYHKKESPLIIPKK